MIEFKHVELKYHYDEYALLKDLDFTLVDGINTVLCDSQSGKSSVCKLLTKEFAPTGGQILLDGQDIASITNASLGILYLQTIPTLFENRSVFYNVTYPLKVRKVDKAEQIKIFDEVAKLVGLTINPKQKVKKLQTDERKRISLARGLTVKRKVVLCDDFCTQKEHIDKIVTLFDGATVVIITSDVALACGNVVVLDGGKTVYCGDVDGAVKVRQNLGWIFDC
ncbi:MAG: ATP-binding cassette domain-containing protein [Clostridia bacterium]|nr:ATP-binding cassette domain-containing protein [Clostridia bacterium]